MKIMSATSLVQETQTHSVQIQSGILQVAPELRSATQGDSKRCLLEVEGWNRRTSEIM